MPLENADEMLQQLEKQIEEEQGKQEEEGQKEAEKTSETPEKEEETPESDDSGDTDDSEDADDAESDPKEDLGAKEVNSDEKKKGSAFKHMRLEQKQLKEQLMQAEKARQELSERLARMEGRKEAEVGTSKPAAEEEEPDELMFPEEHNQWKIRKLEKKLEEVASYATQARQLQTFESERRGVSVLEGQFKEKNPEADYDGATDFLVKREIDAKRLMNPDISEAQARAQVELEKVEMFKKLYQQGRNPAEVVYKLAQQFGYSGKAKGAQENKPKTDLKKLADNQRRTTNLIGGSPASKDQGKATSEQILNMSFQKVLANSNRLFGDSESDLSQ